MPLLDVSDILADADFVENNLLCLRSSQVVGENGLAVNTPLSLKFSGVVTSLSGFQLDRTAAGEIVKGSILICTKFRLIAGVSGFTADIVQRRGKTYTVTDVNDYSSYGRGFVEATCQLLPLSGGTQAPHNC